MINRLNQSIIRRGIRILLALGLAFIINPYLSKTYSYWLPISTLFVMMTATGSALYQGILRYLLLVSVVAVGSFFVSSLSELNARLYDVTLGALLGIVINVTILPDRVDSVFRHVLIPILEAYAVYFSAIIALLLQRDFARAEKAKTSLEEKLTTLPGWVFERGFDNALQKGHRYFLIKMGETSELLFAMHHLARYSFDPHLLLKVRKSLIHLERKVRRFFIALTTVLQLKKLNVGIDDFSDDIRKIEKNFKKAVPLKLEMMDVEKDYVYLIELIYDLKDLHDAMMKMAMAVR